MATQMVSWQMFEVGKPLQFVQSVVPNLSDGEVTVKVAGCGVCHTDLGFYYDGVKTKSSMPLTLGHEISGVVVDTGPGVSQHLIGKAVIIPSVIPCGHCYACSEGLANICVGQKMPGNDINGGFASHIVVPGDKLCEVPVDENLKPIGNVDISLAELSVVADALTTPYQAIVDSNLGIDDTAIFIGTGGVGGFGAQIAKAMGACVIAVDIDQNKLDMIAPYVDAVFDSSKVSFKELRKEISVFVKRYGKKMSKWKIFETSGTASGQTTAFGLLTFGAHLAVVGFTMDLVTVRLSNLMAFHATAKGNWGCLTRYYPLVLDMVLSGQIDLKSFTTMFPLSDANSVFEQVHNRQNFRRAILVP